MSKANLGRLISVHGIAPAYLQRVIVVAVLSFVFFIGMMAAFYLRQKLGYFLLASGFLVIYVLTMFGWLMQRRNVLRIHEHGLTHRKFSAAWDEIASVNVKGAGTAKVTCELSTSDGRKTVLTPALHNLDQIIYTITRNVSRNRSE